MGKYLIVGAGIAGCTAALELAARGHTVDIIERAGGIGGKAVTYCCKATDECTRCGVCFAHTALAAAVANPAVTIHTAAEITAADVSTRGVAVTAAVRQPAVRHNICTDCGACLKACPAKCISRYSRGGLVFYSIDHDRCVRSQGRACSACIKACRPKAITGQGVSAETIFKAAGAVIAAGHTPYDAVGKPRFSFGRLDGVLSGAQAETILAERTYLVKPDEDVAFVQCVGSRDPEICRNYCSSVCCAYAVRMARMLKYRNPGGRVTVYYIDLQNFDKAFSDLRPRIEKEGVRFVRGIPFTIDRGPDGRLAVKSAASESGQSIALHDTVVLSVGMGPAEGSGRMAGLFGLVPDEFGFCSADSGPVVTAGTCRAPGSIADSQATARAAVQVLLNGAAGSKVTEDQPRKGAFKTRKITLDPHVCVIGGGVAGAQAARSLRELGCPVTLVEKSSHPGGSSAEWLKELDFKTLLDGVTVKTGAVITAVTGQVGAFTVQTDVSGKAETLTCGAVVVAAGADVATIDYRTYDSERVVTIGDTLKAMTRFARRDLPRSVGLVLDLKIEESKASTEMALHTALALREMYGCEVFLFCREVRVAALHFEELYDAARAAQVTIIKYAGDLAITGGEDGVTLKAVDTVLEEQISVTCDLVGVSPYGLQSRAERGLVAQLGVGVDALGQVQENNMHLFPGLTSRPGIFTVGAARGQYYVPDIITEARATALDVRRLLGSKHLTVELSNAAVDADKCALCLTCVRACPHGAMTVDREKGAAVSLEAVCQKCGVCVGECPAQAITLPALEAFNA